ncbi:carbohydrate esterase family 3 protein [Whalleya microplaca]|nr:carbohydrate esterase family 3 protein [Whalleya microplaca]
MVAEEKKTWSSRLSFLRTKRAIFVLTMLVIVSVVLIALGATNVFGARNSSDVPSSSSIQQPTQSDAAKNGITIAPGTWNPDNSSSIADGIPLRIMPLGASVVKGENSTKKYGFRKTMRDGLVKLGSPVNMVGSQRYGEMLDNDLEAYGGQKITELYEHAQDIVPQEQPNLFIINVGTNNVLQNNSVDLAGEQLGDLIDYVLEASPRSTVIYSTLLTNLVKDSEPMILDINQQYRKLINRFDSKPVIMVEMHYGQGFPNRPQVKDIGPDLTHPTDYGYELMAHLFLQAIQEADRQGYLRKPVDNGLQLNGNLGRLAATTTTTELPPATSSASSSAVNSTLGR